MLDQMCDDDDDEDLPRLSQATLLALQEFLQDQSNEAETDIKENWQLSQFWYDDKTIQHLSAAAVGLCQENFKIALISCPSLYKKVKSLLENDNKNIEVKVFEFDKRFSTFAPDYVYYDYKEPLNVDSKFNNYFDVILVDPPFLSDECLGKTSETVKLIAKTDSKIVLCTGSVMESSGGKFLNVKKCSFKPMHKNNLANDFICLSNFGELPI